MRLPRRRPSMPPEAMSAVGLLPDARVLAWSELVGGGYAAATAGHLYVLTPFGKQVSRPWVQVDHIAWDDNSRTLAVWWVGSRQALGLELVEASFLPEVMHERVRSSMLVSCEVPLPGRRPATVALRRGVDGTVVSQVSLPAGVGGDDPDVQRAVRAAEARLRQDAGL